MNWWRWLTTPEAAPGVTSAKIIKLALRLLLFVMFVTLVSGVLALTPLGPYVSTFWGSMLLVLALYLPLARWLNVDTFVPARPVPQSTRPAPAPARAKKANYAGVSKKPPKFQGRR